jgi:LysM repeat protein
MNESIKKILIATLVLACGCALSWPFRKSTGSFNSPSSKLSTGLLHNSTSELSQQVLETDPKPILKTTPTTTIAGGALGADDLASTSQISNLTSQDKPSVQIANHHPHTIRQPRSINPSHRIQIHHSGKPLVVSHKSHAAELSMPKQNGSHSQLSPGSDSQVIAGLPTRMPDHYEPEYAFPRPIPPKPKTLASSIGELQPRPAYATAISDLSPTDQSSPVWPQEIIHEIQNSDTLEKLAKRYLGDPARALEIFDFNRDKLKNPEILPIGAELRIPAKE